MRSVVCIGLFAQNSSLSLEASWCAWGTALAKAKRAIRTYLRNASLVNMLMDWGEAADVSALRWISSTIISQLFAKKQVDVIEVDAVWVVCTIYGPGNRIQKCKSALVPGFEGARSESEKHQGGQSWIENGQEITCYLPCLPITSLLDLRPISRRTK